MSNFETNQAAPAEKSKKERRLESKKKKALALLNLLEMKAREGGDMEGPPAKKAHLDGGPDGDTRMAKPTCDITADTRKTQQKAERNGPKIQLTLENLLPFSNINDTAKNALADIIPPLFIVDLQHLLLLALLQNFSFWTPRWCRLMRPKKLSCVVLVVLKDVSLTDFEEHPDCFPFLKSKFLSCVEMVTSSQYGSSLEQDVGTVPLSISQMKRYTNREDVREQICALITKPERQVMEENVMDKSVNRQGTAEATGHSDSKSENKPNPEDEFPRTSLLLSTLQMMEEGYPLPVQTKNGLYDNYVYSCEKYISASHSSPLFGMDCEMCETTEKESELTRVSIVDEQNEIVYDQLVKPRNPITNYLTRFSGMTEELLTPVTTRVEDVQRDIRTLLPPDAILCGQSLWNDLKALKIFHPHVIDTSVAFNQSGSRNVKCGLRKLAYTFLGQQIQRSERGHCSIEDARAALNLVKLKLSKDIEFGDAMLGGVYYPSIKTYFSNPTKAQNVEEIFSSHPVPTLPVTASDPTIACQSQSLPGSIDGEARICGRADGADKKPDQSGGTSDDRDESQTEQRSLGMQDQSKNDGQISHGEDEHQTQDKLVGCCMKDEECRDGAASVNQRGVFFQQEGGSVKCSFFEVLADNKNLCGLVGGRELVSKFQTQPRLECVLADSDEDACSQMFKVSREKDLTWVELRTFTDLLAKESQCAKAGEGVDSLAEQRKHTLSTLDSRVQDIVTSLQDKSLVAVVMTGRSFNGQHLNAATCLKIT